MAQDEAAGWRLKYSAPELNPSQECLGLRAMVADKRKRACERLFSAVHAISSREGITPSALHAIKLKLVALARRADLFPLTDFPMPLAEGRTHTLLIEEDDGLGLYLNIGLPGKEAAPHDHGIWCVNAAIAGRELHQMFRRIDDGGRPGQAALAKIGEVIVEPGVGMAMADHDIHGTLVVGEEPAIGLALYGYALTRFPSVTWYNPEFGTCRAVPSRRHATQGK